MWNLIPQNNTKVTLELREIIESGIDIWDFFYDYPPDVYVYDYETHIDLTIANRIDFQQKVIDHFYFRQIGFETVGRFLHHFRTKIREIMPYYMQRFKSALLLWNDKNPLQSYDLTETFTQEHENTSSQNSEVNGESAHTSLNNQTTTYNSTDAGETRKKFSNTPQGLIENIDDADFITEYTVEHPMMKHTGDDTISISNTGNNNDKTTSEGASSDSGKITHTLTRKGNIGVSTIGKEINEIREAFLNIDMEIIGELECLFLKVY